MIKRGQLKHTTIPAWLKIELRWYKENRMNARLNRSKAAEETISTAVRYLIRGAGSKAASTETLLVEPFTEERDRRSGAIQNQ